MVFSTLMDIISSLQAVWFNYRKMVEVSQKRAVRIPIFSKSGQEVILSWWQLEVPPAVLLSYLWHVE